MGRTLSHAEARSFYDQFGAKQDAQEFYEGQALAALIAHLDLGNARSVIEFGCGTGRFAAQLLADHLPAEARYLGIDISTTMVELSRGRLARFGARAEVRQSDGSPEVAAEEGACDRFLSTYVLDLLSEDEIDAVLATAHRVLAPGGLLGVASLSRGTTPASRLVTWVWERIHGLRPSLVGGCRPIAVADHLRADRWRIRHRGLVTPFGIASEIVVAERIAG